MVPNPQIKESEILAIIVDIGIIAILNICKAKFWENKFKAKNSLFKTKKLHPHYELVELYVIPA